MGQSDLNFIGKSFNWPAFKLEKDSHELKVLVGVE